MQHSSPKLQIDSRGDDIPYKLEDVKLNKDSNQVSSNPFVVPKNQDIFMLRDKDRNQRKKVFV